jgi:hypothetical protein
MSGRERFVAFGAGLSEIGLYKYGHYKQGMKFEENGERKKQALDDQGLL